MDTIKLFGKAESEHSRSVLSNEVITLNKKSYFTRTQVTLFEAPKRSQRLSKKIKTGHHDPLSEGFTKLKKIHNRKVQKKHRKIAEGKVYFSKKVKDSNRSAEKTCDLHSYKRPIKAVNASSSGFSDSIQIHKSREKSVDSKGLIADRRPVLKSKRSTCNTKNSKRFEIKFPVETISIPKPKIITDSATQTNPVSNLNETKFRRSGETIKGKRNPFEVEVNKVFFSKKIETPIERSPNPKVNLPLRRHLPPPQVKKRLIATQFDRVSGINSKTKKGETNELVSSTKNVIGANEHSARNFRIPDCNSPRKDCKDPLKKDTNSTNQKNIRKIKIIMQVKAKPFQNGVSIKNSKNMAITSPEPRGALTPPGSSPLRPNCGHPINFTHESAPPSPETPMTPDSAHMAAEATNHNESFLMEGGDDRQSANHEPLIGARKRKATKVRKVSAECVSQLEGDSAASQGLTCSLCQTVLTSQHDFTRHIRTHNRVVEDDSNGTKLFECGLCHKQLSSNSSLDRHMLVHSGERPFRCHICGTHFTTNGNMHRHIRGHYRNGGGSSDTGDSDGGSDGERLSPRKRLHEGDDDGPVQCKVPRLVGADTEDISEDGEFSCQFCGIEHNDTASLDDHLDKEHPEHRLSLKTSIQVTSTRASATPLNIPKFSFFPPHDQSVSTDRLRNPINAQHCTTCGKSFSSVEEWVIHLREHPILKCSICSLSFDSLSDYTFHQQQHAREYELERKQSPPSIFSHGLPMQLPHQIPHFSHSDPFKLKLFSDLSPLSLTSQSATSNVPSSHSASVSISSNNSLSHDEQFNREYKDMKMNGQYPCRLCKEVFANLRKLKSHNLVHMISPPYQCNLCSFVSNDKNTLKEHMKNHKGDTPYECNLCSLSFTTKANCERHIKNIHGRQTRDEVKKCMTYTPQDDGPASQETSRETICNICQFDCKSRSVLRDHMRSSHPEGIDKPFTCKICQVAFVSRSDAFRHAIQVHQEAVSRESLETLVEQRTHRDDPQDLSSVENMISISRLTLPMASSKQILRQDSPLPLAMSLHQNTPFSTPNPVIPPTLNIPTYIPSLSTEDAPLDLSMNKRKYDDEDDEDNDDDDDDDEEITVIDDDDESDMIKHKHSSFYEKNSTSENDNDAFKSSPESQHPDSRSSSPSEMVKDVKNSFPLIYPSQFPVQLYNFQSRYPFLMPHFGHIPPVPNFDHFKFLEEYQKEIKRGLHLTSGGSILSSEGTNNRLLPAVTNSLLNPVNNQLLNTNATTFQLSALALATSKKEQDHIKINTAEEEIRNENRKRIPEVAVANHETEEITHFSMRNSVLVKKPKQRRYRTERPWRCDLCDKGFTLRSNMERHMKQQHPDLWQQKPRGASTPKSGLNSSLSLETLNQSADSDKIDIKSPIKSENDDASMEDTPEGNKEDDENELVIDDEEDEDDEDDEEETEEESKENEQKSPRDETGADLASVGKLLSTASQNFSFFNKENEESEKTEESFPSPCQSPASQGTSVEEGKRSAYSSAPQKQKCPFCHRKFPWSSSLVRHIRTHTGQKPYLCPVCHFPFTTKSNCDRHLQRKHPDSPHAFAGDRPYRCSKCPGAAFTSVESLRKHDMFKHEKAINDSSLLLDEVKIYALSKPFGCHLCDSRHYSTKEVLDHVAETHPESYKLLQMEDISSPVSHTSPTRENNNETLESSPESATPEMVRCMLCFQKYSNKSELRAHVEANHIHHSNSDSPSTSSAESSQARPLPEEREEMKIDIQNCAEKETSDFISKMLGTKPAVIDHLISSKSTTAADAAKLLGVR